LASGWLDGVPCELHAAAATTTAARPRPRLHNIFFVRDRMAASSGGGKSLSVVAFRPGNSSARVSLLTRSALAEGGRRAILRPPMWAWVRRFVLAVAAACAVGWTGAGCGRTELDDALPVPSLCGNSRVDPGELCDDGNRDDTDSCDNSCRPATCGDG